MAEKQIFQDKGEHWYDFSSRCLVECPDCHRLATVEKLPDRLYRFVCTHCVQKREIDGSCFSTRPTLRDPWFGLPLWLQTACCGETLWAFNEEHITFLEDYVQADLRQGIPLQDSPAMIRNATLASRLPNWIIKSSHRDDVLRGISRLRERLLQTK